MRAVRALLFAGISLGSVSVLARWARVDDQRVRLAAPIAAQEAATGVRLPRVLACETLREMHLWQLEELARLRIRQLQASVDDSSTNAEDRSVLELEGCLLEAILDRRLLAHAFVEDARAALPEVAWTRSGQMTAFAYVLVHEGCAITVRLRREDAEPVFDLWDALRQGGVVTDVAVEAATASSVVPATVSQATPGDKVNGRAPTVFPAEIELGVRPAGYEHWWTVLMRSGRAESLRVESPPLADRVEAIRVPRGEPGRSWIVRGRLVLPQSGRSWRGACRVSIGDGCSEVRLRAGSASAVRLLDRVVRCSPVPHGGWKGKLDFEWCGGGVEPQPEVSLHEAGAQCASHEIIKIGPTAHRLLLRGDGPLPSGKTGCRLELQSAGEDLRQSIPLVPN
jgi:hypothetical protein